MVWVIDNRCKPVGNASTLGVLPKVRLWLTYPEGRRATDIGGIGNCTGDGNTLSRLLVLFICSKIKLIYFHVRLI